MELQELLDILDSIHEDAQNGRIITAAEKIKRLALRLDKDGIGKSIHLVQYGGG